MNNPAEDASARALDSVREDVARKQAEAEIRAAIHAERAAAMGGLPPPPVSTESPEEAARKEMEEIRRQLDAQAKPPAPGELPRKTM